MAVFGSTEELYDVLLPFYNTLVTDPVIGPQFAKANTSFRIRHHDPDGVFLLEATSEPVEIYHAAEADGREAAVELTMSGDDGHRFWLGELNLPMALARKKIKVDGGVTKLLGLVPAMQPAYGAYRQYLDGLGRPVG